MANDYTKYNIDFLSPDVSSIENLSKRQLVLATIKYVIEHDIVPISELNAANLNPTHNKQLVATEVEYSGFASDKTKRYSLIRSSKGNFYVSNQWRKSTLDNFIDYFENKCPSNFQITELEEEEVEEDNDIKIKTPLNQIFYGPPGTGKTYNVSNETEKIINEKNNNSGLSREDKFDRICKSIRTKYNDNIYNKLNANTIYRNFSKIMVVLGWFLDDKYNSTNTIIHDDLKDTEGFKRSGWSQRLRYLTEFDLIEGNWKSDFAGQLGSDMTLNQRGIKLKNKLRDYINDKNIDKEELKVWSREKGLPDFITNEYFDILSELSPLSDQMTAFKKTIICALNMGLNGDLFKQNIESRDSTNEEIDIIKKYLDVTENNNSDFKWIGWIAENMADLGLVVQTSVTKDERNYFKLTQRGEELINNLILNWEKEQSSLFVKYLNYELALSLGLIKFITFHQSYSYEEFIEGIRPDLNSEDELKYRLEDGIFKEFSIRAKNDPANNYVFIIDEINRGNISKIFGELITLIEPTKRLFATPKEHPQEVSLPYSKKLFGVPNNLYLIGTMNTADRSITNLDTALRRRFVFQEYLPTYNHPKIGAVNQNGLEINLQKVLEVMNSRIEFLLDRDHLIGHSYLMDVNTWELLCDKFRNNIIPLLQEYFYNDWKKIALVFGDNDTWGKSEKEKLIQKKEYSQDGLFGKGNNIEDEYDGDQYFINPDLVLKKYENLSEQFFIKGFQ